MKKLLIILIIVFAFAIDPTTDPPTGGRYFPSMQTMFVFAFPEGGGDFENGDWLIAVATDLSTLSKQGVGSREVKSGYVDVPAMGDDNTVWSGEEWMEIYDCHTVDYLQPGDTFELYIYDVGEDRMYYTDITEKFNWITRQWTANNAGNSFVFSNGDLPIVRVARGEALGMIDEMFFRMFNDLEINNLLLCNKVRELSNENRMLKIQLEMTQ